jgi:hypothetical protein
MENSMILRRLGQAITEQNWFVVIVEVLVVVVGIFVGLQVDDWNAARHDKRDEQEILERLHAELLLGEELSRRVRSRRLDRLQIVMSASDVLFDRAGRNTLSDEECIVLGSSNFFNINVPSLAAHNELVGTGRLGIIQDTPLRSGLVSLEQTRAALASLIAVQTAQSSFIFLPAAYPELMQLESDYNADAGEIMFRSHCDLEKMRANQAFLNQWSANADGYDAYIRDGLAPWAAQFEHVHRLVDDALGITHEIPQE